MRLSAFGLVYDIYLYVYNIYIIQSRDDFMKDQDFSTLVSEDCVHVSRRLFYDDAIFEVEKTKVFGRSWLFLGHESQIAKLGDYFLTRI